MPSTEQLAELSLAPMIFLYLSQVNLLSTRKSILQKNDLSSIISLDFPQRLIIIIQKKSNVIIYTSNLYTSEIIQYIFNLYLITAFLLY